MAESLGTEIFMPSMGEGVIEATLVRWIKKPGEMVKEDEPLLEVSTDKVDTEIPSPVTGVVSKTLANEGDVIKVDSVIALISTSQSGGKSAPAPAAATAAKAPSALTPEASASSTQSASAKQYPELHRQEVVSPTAQKGTHTNLRSSPLVRKMAAAGNIDLSQVTGTGLHGRITKRDMETHVARPSNSQTIPAHGQAPAAQHHSDRVTTQMINGRECLEGVPVRREKMSVMRTKIAEHMVRSVRVSPHVTTIFEMDMHRIVALREKYQAEFLRQQGFKLTFTPFFVHASMLAIKKNPIVNCSVDGTDILFKDDINIGCAVALENGLIVPVVKRAQDLNLLGTARKLNDLVVRARSKKLTPEDVQGGTFSITNPGIFGSIASNPIISQPQVAILGLGAIVKRPVVINDMIAIRPMCNIGLTFDHRVVDGEGGARYLADLKNIIENYDEVPV
jgi:2-oxoglutarate dehydrogenase dihydrolipoamide succinyltransferase (E2 component)